MDDAEHKVHLNMNFKVLVEGEEIACKAVQGLEEEQEQEYIREGGLNDSVHIRPKPASKPQVLKLERYITADYKDVLKVGQVLGQPLIVETSPEVWGNTSVRFQFLGGVVTNRQFGGLHAERKGLLEETVSIAYREMRVEYVR